jgi:hypothetical protein
MTQLVGGPHDGLEVEFHPGALYLDIPEAEGVALVAFSRYDLYGTARSEVYGLKDVRTRLDSTG